MNELKFEDGHVFFKPGDPSDRAFLLKTGDVEILNLDGQRLATLNPGDVFGEMALVEERPHGFLARAATDGIVETLTRAEFESSLLHDPARAKHYLTRLFERLRLLAARVGDESEPEQPSEPQSTGITLTPLTPKARASLRDDGVALWKLPFRIGRASEANEPEALDLNDLWLNDEKPFIVSRNHLSIDAFDRGLFVIRDRGSFLGTLVNGEMIGGKSKRRAAELKVGDNTIVIGPADSPFQFRLTVPSGKE